MNVKVNIFMSLLYIYDYSLVSEPTAIVVRNRSQHSTTLTCQVARSGCHVKRVVWIDPKGNRIKPSQSYKREDKIVRSIVVTSQSHEGSYTCKVYYTGGSNTGVYLHTGKALCVDCSVLYEKCVLSVMLMVLWKF